MFLSNQTLVALALLPLLAGVLLQLLAARLLSARSKGVLALACALPSLAAVVAAFQRVAVSGPMHFTAFGWDGPLAMVFHLDALGLMFALMGTGLGAFVLLYSIDYMAHDRSATRFYAFMLTFICGMVGLVASANLFSVYLCWEAMGLCSFSLVGFWYDQPAAVAGARKVLLMTHLAGYGLLAAILLLFSRTGSALWTDPAVGQAFSNGVYLLMLVALLAKSVQFPLHTWIPEAMNAPTPVSALLHAACYVKAGVYLAARMHGFCAWPASWSLTMMYLGTVTMVVGVAYAMVQHDLKRMLAFHTVSQIGYIITGLGLGTPLGIAAGLLHCLNHSLFKGGLFLAAGSVQHAAGTRDMNKLGGLSHKMPRTAVVWLISVSSMMGVPFLSGFASKWLLYTAALQSGQVVPALAAWVVSVGTVFSCVKATSTVFLGQTSEATEHAHEAPLTMQWALGLFAAGSVLLGVAPQLAVNWIINPILPVLGMATVQVSWFGLTPAAGSWWTTGGLMLALVSAGIGFILYMLAGFSRARTLATQQFSLAGAGAGGTILGGGGAGVFTGGESLSGPARLPASDFSSMLKRLWAPLYRATDVDHVWMGAWRVLESLSGLLRNSLAWAESATLFWTLLLTAATFFAVRGFPAASFATANAGSEVLPSLLALGCAVAFAALLLAAIAQKAWRNLAPLLLLSGLSAVGATYVAQPTARLAFLEVASLLALAQVWKKSSRRATWLYASVIAVSAACLIAAQIVPQTDLARALTLTGFVLKLGIVPALLWLPVLAAEVPALTLGLIVAVIDIAAFGELQLTAQAHAGLFEPHGFWIAIALATSLLAALRMLTESNIKRLLALSTLEDMGFLLLGLLSASSLGMKGALLAATVHALAKALLFISISAPEADGALHRGGLAMRYPFSAAGFLAGSLAMLGIPPMLGFAGRWRLYECAALIHPALLALFIACSICALIAYVLCFTRCWWGPWKDGSIRTAPEPLALRLAILGLIVVLLAGGLWPDSLLALAGGLQ
jgi:multicomponent Na+:H+ antiporter subunit A